MPFVASASVWTESSSTWTITWQVLTSKTEEKTKSVVLYENVDLFRLLMHGNDGAHKDAKLIKLLAFSLRYLQLNRFG